MRIEEIKLTDHIDEMWELFSLHRDELATHKDIMVLKPDWDRYRNLENAGMLLTLAVYDENKIIGYSVTLLYHNMHYFDLADAFNDVLYIHSSYRNRPWGIRLIKRTEDEVRKRGAKMMLFHGKPGTVFSTIMPRMGYNVQDIVLSKEL